MCNRYRPPSADAIRISWPDLALQASDWPSSVHPRSPGPFLRADGSGAELTVGQWALIPPWAKAAKLPYSTNNARSEELSKKPAFRDAWRQGQRCIIPAESFDEPNWESGKNVWWRFRRADGEPWGLAGLWNTWVDRETGEVHESYTMLTINADDHLLMRRMHKPDPAYGPDDQDKRSVIVIEREDEATWLHGDRDAASALLRLSPASVFDAGPA